MTVIGSKIIDYLRLFQTPGSGIHINMEDFPSLTEEDVSSTWKSWTFNLEKLAHIFFKKDGFTEYPHKDSKCYQRAICFWLVANVFTDPEEDNPEYTKEKYLEDVKETIHIIQRRIQGKKIIDYLTLLASEDKYKDYDELDLSRYAWLEGSDIDGCTSKDNAFEVCSLISEFFDTKSEDDEKYYKGCCYVRTSSYICGNCFGTPNYPYEKHLEDVKETIETINLIVDHI